MFSLINLGFATLSNSTPDFQKWTVSVAKSGKKYPYTNEQTGSGKSRKNYEKLSLFPFNPLIFKNGQIGRWHKVDN